LNKKTEDFLSLKEKLATDDISPSSASLPEFNSEEFPHPSTFPNSVITV
jgi:hypothetical protein